MAHLRVTAVNTAYSLREEKTPLECRLTRQHRSTVFPYQTIAQSIHYSDINGTKADIYAGYSGDRQAMSVTLPAWTNRMGI